jgi:hypothetical protein
MEFTYTKLEAWHLIGLLMDESPFRHPIPNREVSSILKIALANNFPPQSAYLEFSTVLTAVVYAARR